MGRNAGAYFTYHLHLLFPLISTGALIYALVYSFIPFPPRRTNGRR